jgi:signal transduction histidine kinase
MSTPPAQFSLLLASSVHDIKNSLGMLLSTLEGVIEDTPAMDAQQRLRFATLQGEAARINNALIYLLGIYRLQQEQLPVRIEAVFVADFLDEQRANQQLLSDIRGLELAVICDEQLSAYFDPALIAGVIDNMLVNAARYARSRIELRAEAGPDGLCIEVRDDGPGFPAKILDALHNHDRGIDFSSGSTNLGLYFAVEVARLHRRGETCGSVELVNLNGGGSCFRLRLP